MERGGDRHCSDGISFTNRCLFSCADTDKTVFVQAHLVLVVSNILKEKFHFELVDL